MKSKLKNINSKLFLFIMSLFVSFLCILPGLMPEMYVGKDFAFHVYRIQEMASNIVRDGVYFPSLQANNIFGYGYLIDIFYPNLFLYPAAFLTILIKNPLTALKILIFIYTIFTFYLSYFSAKLTTTHEKFPLYFAIFYCLYPYRILDLYCNGFMGEFFSYSFLPLVIFGMHRLFKENKWKMLAIGMIGIVYSHLITLLLATIYIGIYSIINIKSIVKDFKIALNLLKATITTMLVGSAFLLPLISYMESDTYKYNKNADLSGIVAYGLFDLPIVIEVLIFTVFTFMAFYAYKDLKKKFDSKELLISLIVMVYSMLMMTKTFPWELLDYIPFLRNIQFSIRIFNLVSPFMVFIFVYFALCLKDMNKVFFFFFTSCILTLMVTTKYEIKQSGEEITNYDIEYANVKGYQAGTYFEILGGEYVPLSLSINNLDLYDITDDILLKYNKPEFSNNVLDYELIKDGSLTTTLIVETKENVDVTLPLIYYQNYKAYLEGEELEIYEKDGRVSIKDITSGTIIIRFEVSDLQKMSFVISLLTLIMFGIYEIKIYLKKCLQNINKMV